MAKNIETIESLLSTIPIEGPRLIITKDTKEIYYETSNKTRILLGTSSGSGSVSEEDVEKILEKLSTFTDEDITNLIKKQEICHNYSIDCSNNYSPCCYIFSYHS